MADAENEVVFLDNENNTITRIIVLQRLALIKSIICILYWGHCMHANISQILISYVNIRDENNPEVCQGKENIQRERGNLKRIFIFYI